MHQAIINTLAAKGIARKLYPVAQIKFCFILLYVAFQTRHGLHYLKSRPLSPKRITGSADFIE